tara:strand:- start:294 stop:848 length:555 start_codon:yes stop_codon:yes gene_type:complete
MPLTKLNATKGLTGTLPAVSGANLTGISAGILNADIYRYTASTGGADGDITANLERVDDASTGFIGTGMSVSSGVFSFPSTGIYLLLMQCHINFVNEADNGALVTAKVTLNNSSYDDVCRVFAGSNSTSNNSRFTVYAHAIIDVTDTSNVKVKFTGSSFDSQTYLEGNTDQNDTSFTFIRLGDT